ncbi:hypothetical protein R6Q59_010251 [Mikania micrantha]
MGGVAIPMLKIFTMFSSFFMASLALPDADMCLARRIRRDTGEKGRDIGMVLDQTLANCCSSFAVIFFSFWDEVHYNSIYPEEGMATYARRHGGDGGDRPPHGNSSRILEKFTSNNNKPLELDLYPKGGTHKFVGENASLFIRCISNEVARVPFHYPSWDRVPKHDKLGIYHTLHHYFYLQRWLGTPDWDGIRAGINEDCARRYRDRKN